MKSKSKTKIFVGFILSFAVLFYVFGLIIYKKTGDKFFSKIFRSQNKDVKQDEERVVGDSTFGLPIDFPVYRNSDMLNSWSVEDSKNATSVVWESEDSVREVVDYYNVELKRKGWEITSSIFTEESSIFSFEKDGSKGFMGITEEDGNTVISATIEFSK